MKPWIKITFRFLSSHLFSYLVVSIPYYNLVMKDYYVGENSVFSKFLITEANVSEWATAMKLLFPFQILHALCFVVLLLLVFDWFQKQSFAKQFFFLFWIKSILGGIATIAPSPGTLEGILFFHPMITAKIHSLVALEILVQGALTAFIFTLWNRKVDGGNR
ncbi:hypothetical protein [Leptospira idonii]|uniref:Uncharacterized protein n=1 Tax=Leptospira idonii TaxID=1193500 RepID=A0A4R9M3L4_9LEPT|nr:hypothetical protein [Leptospira idonii]TGN19869.1 hypothetical protein EHS15_06620 [Leptospira idonii]